MKREIRPLSGRELPPYEYEIDGCILFIYLTEPDWEGESLTNCIEHVVAHIVQEEDEINPMELIVLYEDSEGIIDRVIVNLDRSYYQIERLGATSLIDAKATLAAQLLSAGFSASDIDTVLGTK